MQPSDNYILQGADGGQPRVLAPAVSMIHQDLKGS